MLEKVIAQGGTFAGAPKSDHLEQLADKTMKSPPWGLPKRKKDWHHPTLLAFRPLGVENAEYETWLRDVFGRTVPGAISYSCVSDIIFSISPCDWLLTSFSLLLSDSNYPLSDGYTLEQPAVHG